MTGLVELAAKLVTPAFLALMTSATMLVLFNDWRIRLAALAFQYTAATALVLQLVLPVVGAAKLIVGMLVVSILTLTASQFGFGRTREEAAAEARTSLRRFEVPTGFPFRVFVTLMVGAAAVYLASQPALALPGLQRAPVLNTSSYLLMAFGLLNLGLTEDPMRAGMGLLTLMTGFEVFYVAVEPSLAIVALLAAVEFGIALAVSYLTALQYGDRTEAPAG
jgi:hypothetical protein